MRPIIIFILVVLPSYFCTAQVEIKGKIENCYQCDIQAIIDYSKLEADKHFENSYPDQYGNFVFDLKDITSPTSIVLDIDGRRFPMFVKPKTKIWVTVHGPSDSAYVTFDDLLIDENIHLAAIARDYGWVGDRINYDTWFEQYHVGVSPSFIQEYENQPEEQKLAFLVNKYREMMNKVKWEEVYQFDSAYSTFIERYVRHAAPAMLYSFLLTRDLTTAEKQLVAEATADADFPNDERDSPSFIPHLKSYVAYDAKIVGANPSDFITYFDATFQQAPKIPQDLKDEYLLHILIKQLNASSVQRLKPTIEQFAKSLSQLDQMSELMVAYNKAIQQANGLKAPNFRLQDADGTYVSLSSFKGQNVYLVFWSSSCKPCIEGMKKSVANKEKLYGQNLRFLYVSTDADRATWLSNKYVQQHPDNDIHLWIGKSKPELHQYNAISLPSYYFINKRGQFVTQFPNSWEPDFVTFVQRLP